MKNICALALVIIGGRLVAGCSDDGIYTQDHYDDFDAGAEVVDAAPLETSEAGQVVP